MCLSYSNFHPIADDCCKATWSQTESPLAFHGKDNWECLGLYHRNHKNKGFNGDCHSPGLVISRCVACVLAIHAQVMGVGRKGLMAAPCPPCAWQHTGNPQLMNSPGWQRLADLCIRFFQNKESGCKAPIIKGKTCIPKHREQGFRRQQHKTRGNNSE